MSNIRLSATDLRKVKLNALGDEFKKNLKRSAQLFIKLSFGSVVDTFVRRSYLDSKFKEGDRVKFNSYSRGNVISGKILNCYSVISNNDINYRYIIRPDFSDSTELDAAESELSFND